MARCPECEQVVGHLPGCSFDNPSNKFDNSFDNDDLSKGYLNKSGRDVLDELRNSNGMMPEPLPKLKPIRGAPITGPLLPTFTGFPDPLTGELKSEVGEPTFVGIHGHRLVHTREGTVLAKIEGDKIINNSGVQVGTLGPDNEVIIPGWPNTQSIVE